MDLIPTAIAVITGALSAAGTSFSKKAGETAFNKCSEFAERLITKVKSKGATDKTLKEALDSVVAAPDDIQSRNTLDAQLRNACSNDASFENSLKDILQEVHAVLGDSIFQNITVEQSASATIIGKNINRR